MELPGLRGQRGTCPGAGEAAVSKHSLCGSPTCSSRLLVAPPPPAAILLCHALLLAAGCPWKASSLWKASFHLLPQQLWERGQILLCSAAGMHSKHSICNHLPVPATPSHRAPDPAAVLARARAAGDTAATTVPGFPWPQRGLMYG